MILNANCSACQLDLLVWVLQTHAHRVKKQFKNSEELTAPLLELILAQDRKSQNTCERRRIVFGKYKKNQTEADLDGQLRKIEGQASNELKIAIEQRCEKGASSWVTARPRYSHPWTVLQGRIP